MKLKTQALMLGLIIAIVFNLLIIYSALFYAPSEKVFEQFTGRGMAGSVDMCIDWFINLSVLPAQTTIYNQVFSLDINLTHNEDTYYPQLNFTDNTTLFEINSTTGVIIWTPNSSHEGFHSINITVGNNACREPDDSMILVIEVRRPNYAPIINMTNVTLTEDVNFWFNVTNYTYDPDGDLLKFYDNYANFVIGEDSGIIDFTPGDDDVGNHTIRLTVIDPGLLLDFQDVLFTILNVNDAPNLSTVGSKTAEINVTLNITLTAYDPDPNEALTFSSNTSWFLNSSGSISTSSRWSNYIFSVLITDSSWINLTFSINITVNDTSGAEDSEVISFTVVRYNNPPNITSYSPLQKILSMYTDECQNFSITKEDLDGTIPSVTWVYNNTDSGETSDEYKFCPPNAGVFNITVTITDGIANDSESWLVTSLVRPPPEPSSTTPSGAGAGGAGMFCHPNWLCTDWQFCQIGNIQERMCWDRNRCGTIDGKPNETKSCIYTEFPTCFDGIKNQDELLIDCGGICKDCPTCDDNIQNHGETGIDCGGPCPVCKEVLAPVEVKKLPVQLKQIFSKLSLYWLFWLVLSILFLSMIRAVKEINIEKIKKVKGSVKSKVEVHKVNKLLALAYKEIKAKNHEKAKVFYNEAKAMYEKLSDEEKKKVKVNGLQAK
ncbi:MAG: hypothetical protein KJ955_01500 [Nanoarchaeota archaeon]|nr:hypothetical protein [Nanoarchaeota archaeon]